MKNTYTPLMLEIQEIKVEQGFALSGFNEFFEFDFGGWKMF